MSASLAHQSQLKTALKALEALDEELRATGIGSTDRTFNLTWHDWLNTKSLIEVSQAITAAALWRENSRGAHYREDHPHEGSLEDSYFTVVQREAESLGITQRPVEFSIVKTRRVFVGGGAVGPGG